MLIFKLKTGAAQDLVLVRVQAWTRHRQTYQQGLPQTNKGKHTKDKIIDNRIFKYTVPKE